MDDFWDNISRYPRYLITITLGIFFALYDRVKPLLKQPVTATALIGVLISGFAFIFFTLRAMLGMSVV
ncbi:DUF751 family protein [Oscillatoria salina]|uniref:DUF751 family protein n=1 Tax=Oscillatoria salina TaxID=331517 RepID=UPI0013BC755E|nr:DUF751 family protein [Oscillatoria salina]MBZ8182657.1 DUF751 family protein [Oscillatoria salina IIICB1]NET89879.1 DUF751 family protein [Kamptonema sp. SIO1D9]